MFVYPSEGSRIQFPYGEVLEDRENTARLISQICSSEKLTKGINQLLETNSWTITSIPLAQVKIDRWANLLFDRWASLPVATKFRAGQLGMASNTFEVDLRGKFVNGHRTRIRVLTTALHLLAHTQNQVLGRDLAYAITTGAWFRFFQEENARG